MFVWWVSGVWVQVYVCSEHQIYAQQDTNAYAALCRIQGMAHVAHKVIRAPLIACLLLLV